MIIVASITYNKETKTIRFNNINEFEAECDKAFKLNGAKMKIKFKKGDVFKIIKEDKQLKEIINLTQGVIEGNITVQQQNQKSPKQNINNKSNDSDLMDKSRKLIDEKFEVLKEQIMKVAEDSKRKEEELDQIISMLKNETDDSSESQLEGSKKQESKPYLVKWVTHQTNVKVTGNTDYPFMIKANNCGDVSWPNTEIYSIQRSTKSIQINPERLEIKIKPSKLIAKKVVLQTKNRNAGNYVCELQLRNYDTKEEFGDPLEINIDILHKKSEEEKKKIMSEIGNAFPNKTYQDIIYACEKHNFDINEIWQEFSISTEI